MSKIVPQKVMFTYRVILLIPVMISSILLAQDRSPKMPIHDLKKPTVPDSYISKVANVWTTLSNLGWIAGWEPRYIWPAGTENEYLWVGGIWVAGINPNDEKQCSAAFWDGEWYPTRDAGDVIRLFQAEDPNFQIRPNVNPFFDGRQVSAEDTYSEYTDIYNLERHTGDGTPMGLKIIERTYKWTDSYNYNFIIFDYQVINVGLDYDKDLQPDTPQELRDVYIGLWCDADVSLDTWYDDLVAYEPEKQLSYIYDSDDFWTPEEDTGDNGLSEGFLYGKLLKAAGGSEFKSYENPCSHSWWDDDRRPETDIAKFDIMSRPHYDEIPDEPLDVRFLQSVGPFNMKADDTVNVVWAIGVGKGLSNSIQDSDWAKRIFDNGYLAPSAPDPPELNTEKGEGSIRLTWDSAAELSTDLLTGQNDFEGYRVYKSRQVDELGANIWTKLADFDLVNAIGVNTGLQYEFIDSDVLDGFGYSYAITAYDRGDAEQGLDNLESSRRAEISSTYIVMSSPVQTSVDNIYVYPNPYVGSAQWDHLPSEDEPFRRKLVFANLPKGHVSIKIFTLAGDHVDLVEKENDESLATWDLLTQHERQVISGIYLYAVESEYGKFIGKFVVIQ
jgi:hypothetical protein